MVRSKRHNSGENTVWLVGWGFMCRYVFCAGSEGGSVGGWLGGERDQQFFSTSIISAIRGSEAVFKYSNS
jgi:hypothetical protein